MSTPFLVLGLVFAARLFVGSASDFGEIDRDRSAAEWVAAREQERLTADWPDLESYRWLEAWMTDAGAQHTGTSLVRWCVALPSSGAVGPAVRMTFEIDHAADRSILRGSSTNAQATSVAEVTAPEDWPGDWRRTVRAASTAPLGGACA